MRRILCAALPIMLITSPPPARSQQLSAKEQESRDKIETILRIQDTRTPVNGALQRALGDPDPVVRGRAALACASLQDTTLLDLLTRLLDDPPLSSVSAFAIGQTGTALSPAGRLRLEHDLLWNRLGITRALEPLLDGLGRFCTNTGLEEMLVKLEASSDREVTVGVIAAIARCAIRGVTSDRAVQYLLRQTVPPESTPWMVVYALQRTGAHAEVVRQFERLLPLRTHADPLARMHYATLLGKLSSQRDVREQLAAMMERDPDPRVRVSACRALSPIPSFDPELFRRALLSDDEHLQVAAVQGIAGARWLLTEKTPAVEGLFAELERVARNSGGGYHWLVQGEAALALARQHRGFVELPGRPDRPARPEGPERPARPELRPYELRVLAAARPEEARVRFEEEVQAGPSPAAVVALEEALTILRSAPADSSLRRQVRKLAADALRRKDVAITATAASVLTDSLLLAPDAAPLLLEALAAQTLSDDLEAILAIVEGLGVTRDTRALPALNEALRSPEPSVARAAAKALKQITGRDHSGLIPEPGSPLHTDFDFRRLWSLPDTVQMTIETTSGPIAIELYPREAPFTVLNFVRLATERRYFDGLTFHRVVPNFVAQGGDPRGDGWGGPGYTIRSEFTQRSYGTGSIGMASAGKDTEGSQFFITHSPQPHLDGRYTLFGRVVTGQQAVDRLQVGDRMTAVRMGW